MPRTAKFPGSSNIKSATLGDDGVLEVTFQNGQSASYRNFTADLMDEWEKDKSPGGWFHRNVRSKADAFPRADKADAAPQADEAKAADVAKLDDLIDAALPGPTPAGPERDGADASSEPLERATPAEHANALTLADGVVVTEEKCTDAVRVAARAMYESYVTNARGKNYEGKPCPKWEDLTTAIRGHWCAAAITASCEFQGDLLRQVEALQAEARKLKMMLPWRNRGQLGGSRS